MVDKLGNTINSGDLVSFRAGTTISFGRVLDASTGLIYGLESMRELPPSSSRTYVKVTEQGKYQGIALSRVHLTN